MTFYKILLRSIFAINLLLLISNCAPKKTLSCTVTSEPTGADIFLGQTQYNLTRLTYRSHTPYTPNTYSFIAFGAFWEPCYFQVKKDGYHDSAIVFKPRTEENRYVHFTLRPITYSTIDHTYKITVKNFDGDPIKDALIKYTSSSNELLGKEEGSQVTNSNGSASISVKATTPKGSAQPNYQTSLDYKIEKEGYYSKDGSLNSKSESPKIINEDITLISPLDYIDKKFLSSKEGSALKAKILAFNNILQLQAVLSGAVLQKRSINLDEFKNKKYLSFGFDSLNVYNSIKLNKYDIGKRLFDDIVRKILNPLIKYINDPNSFYGYAIKIKGHTKSFIKDSDITKDIRYSFYIPQRVAEQYKAKDISGQAVLNSSIILMDDERIELKLQ